MTLLILAAGLGSRFGGLKQIAPIGPSNEFIIDYSCYDAIHAGFDKIVFVIKEENYDIFRETIGRRVEAHIKVEYAFQDPNDLPEGFSVPEGRTKPWGTGHAILSARHCIDDCFATINADDFYGASTYHIMAEKLSNSKTQSGVMQCSMAGYRLTNTLTDNGSVARGICRIDGEGRLLDITERTAIYKKGADAEYEDESGNRVFLPGESVASMNFFGLMPEIFDFAWDEFRNFLGELKDPMKSEFYLPTIVSRAMQCGKATVEVCHTPDVWYGVTYSADSEKVMTRIRELIASGVYSEDLWRSFN